MIKAIVGLLRHGIELIACSNLDQHGRRGSFEKTETIEHGVTKVRQAIEALNSTIAVDA
ncbi:hypothetical protein [Leptolyngbya sp. GGD]|uniref:hypothetical protein n=1 Tax=Leptolyngbya sp. GGD TaxID=2997907 RepID=UPI00227AF5F6|nr:hypothetical protein [Leptolyngbya sp. GGD]MCY6488921.1 hypothetical protein [Leptolyngbya sp. GGD]